MQLKPNSGIDTSHWEKGLWISQLNPLPRFLITKATEGDFYRDDTASIFAAQSRALGIPFGFYHFWRPNDPRVQADMFLSWVNNAGGFERIRPVLDLEIDLTNQASKVKEWLDYVELRTNKRPILYGRKDVFDTLGNPYWLKNYDIWTACYPADPDSWDWIPPLYSVTAGKREIMWQYSEHYVYPQFPAIEVDTNIAIPDFLNEIGEVIPPTGVTMKEGTAKVDLNIRSGPYPASVIGLLKVGDKVYGDIDTVSNWFHFNKIVRVSGATETVDGWCSTATAYITIIDYVPPVTKLPDLNITIQATGYPTTNITIKPL